MSDWLRRLTLMGRRRRSPQATACSALCARHRRYSQSS
jgi:hypothetical protein